MDVVNPTQDARPAKRPRSLEKPSACDVALAQKQQQEDGTVSLLSLPDGVLYHVLSLLPASSLMGLSAVCRYFRNLDGGNGLSLTHRFAKESLGRLVGDKQASRWSHYNWLQRLAIEETVTKFDRVRGEAQAFTFKELAESGAVTEIKLEQPGPRMVLSELSTAQSPVLRWKLLLRGNNAVEFGVVPVGLEDLPKALHKCLPTNEPVDRAGERPVERATGFSSAITVGSLLPARLPIMKGTVVEIMATRQEISFIITNPEDGAEMIWQNNSTISRAYKGPRELRLQLPCNYASPVKLAVTAWQRAAFEVLHTLSPQEQQAAQQQSQKPAAQPP